MESSRASTLMKAIGPGLLFAGAAIGGSHLGQSTRAGAMFGLGLLGVVLVANVTKYPGLSFGSRYTNATGLSLLEGYRRQGVWTLLVFSALTLGTMFTVAAAVTLVPGASLLPTVLYAIPHWIYISFPYHRPDRPQQPPRVWGTPRASRRRCTCERVCATRASL